MEYLFEFKGYSPEFNEWVSKEQLGRIWIGMGLLC
jgi:hypothetical protein